MSQPSSASPPLVPNKDLVLSLARRIDDKAQHVDIGRETGNGLAKLVLALVNLIHELLERQAIRRIEAGSLNDEQAEALGEALRCQALTILELCKEFGIAEEDLNIDLGPLGELVGGIT